MAFAVAWLSLGGATGHIVDSAAVTNYDGSTKAFACTLDGVTQTQSITREAFGAPRAMCQ